MRVRLQQAGKRFEGKPVLQGIDFEMKPGERPVISGANGSGKSTLLKLIAGFLRPSEGSVEHLLAEKPLDPADAYRYVALAAPYLQFPRELTVMENIRIWERFRPFKTDAERIPAMVRLEAARERRIRELSSGMEQRLKLGIAFASAAPLLLLDEPLTNIDAEGRERYHELLEQEDEERSILVCSNQPEEEAPRQHTRYRIEAGTLREA